MIISVGDDIPPAWKDLMVALALMSKGHVNDISPTFCNHETLTVFADPHKFSEEELVRLKTLGFVSSEETVKVCPGRHCEAMFTSSRFGSA